MYLRHGKDTQKSYNDKKTTIKRRGTKKIKRETSVMAGEYEHIKGKGNRFSSTNQPKRNGRKPSLYNLIKNTIKVNDVEAELSKEDYFKLVAFLIERPLKELKEIASNDETPIWIVNIIRAIISDANAGQMRTLDSLFDRMFGKATMEMKAEVNTTVKPRTLTDEEIKELNLRFFGEY